MTSKAPANRSPNQPAIHLPSGRPYRRSFLFGQALLQQAIPPFSQIIEQLRMLRL